MFTNAFTIGRGEECEVRVDSSLASRRHVEVLFVESAWWIKDLDSTNGTFVEGRRVERIELRGRVVLQLGQDGPSLELAVEEDASDKPLARSNPQGDSVAAPPQETTHGALPPESARAFGSTSPVFGSGKRTTGEGAKFDGSPQEPNHAIGNGTLDRYINHYFADDGRAAGEHTNFIRRAYVEVHKKQRRKYTWVIAAAVVVALGAAAIAGYQQIQMQRQEAAAAALFFDMKEQALATARFKAVLEESGNAALDEQMAELELRRRRMAARYDGYVKELGIYRKLSEEEQVIYDVARVFNESEFQMPAGFVREVRSMIDDYWLQEGRGRFINGVRRAEEMGYTEIIVETLQRYGLPPEFFYLALQESNFDVRATGPWTRWGIAKGMWQFIPSTGQRFGLSIGPREDIRVYDPQDERHDLEKSTEAAAKYLLEIYSTLAQASGLLVIASYNWGEHRIVNKLESLPGPQSIPVEAFEGIPEDPRERNYWRFLGEYSDRMPEETKDYVLKIFAAAVIGQNPRLFGFDFDNTLQRYMEAPL